MTNLTPAARLKVKGDTFFLPVPNDGVYFRNNVGTFRMEGEMIDKWIEKLLPMFNGEHTLADLTNGLSKLHRDQVYEIAEVLYSKGYVRDASRDRPHQLSAEVVEKYAAQIAYLDSFGDSGASRFQSYRHTDVLAVGSGPFFVSLVSALLESGLPKFHMAITDAATTNRQRLTQLIEQARKSDADVLVEEIALPAEGDGGWRDAVRPYRSVLYVSQEGNVEELRLLQAACRAERKLFLPAVCVHQIGMAGPLVHPELDGCWESAWRRLHRSAVQKDAELHVFSPTAGALLANVIVFELFKTVTGAAGPELRNGVFLLDLETLEGNWHAFLAHPLVRRGEAAEWTQASELRWDGNAEPQDTNRLFSSFARLTSAQTGIFHLWEEGDLRQLPLSQCLVQAADPLSEAPAELLPERICSGLTHEEARREAGLTGIEDYVSRLTGVLLDTEEEIVGIGAGETAAEAVVRGLQAFLAKQLYRSHQSRQTPVARLRLHRVDDERCRFYLQALTVMRGAPAIGLGEAVSGFPVVWVGTGDCSYGCADLNLTLALQKALKAALQKEQNRSGGCGIRVLETSSVFAETGAPVHAAIPSAQGRPSQNILREAQQVLKKNGKRLFVADLAAEPFLKEELGGVFGVLLREEEAR